MAKLVLVLATLLLLGCAKHSYVAICDGKQYKIEGVQGFEMGAGGCVRFLLHAQTYAVLCNCNAVSTLPEEKK